MLSTQPAAIVRHDVSPEWRSVLSSRFPIVVEAAAPEPIEAVEYPRENLPVAVEVVADGRSMDGQWQQTVRLTIKPGGNLGYASQIAFGNVQHVDELFAIARKSNPGLRSPAFVPIGQQIDLVVDPTRVFVLERVEADQEKIVRAFANGVRETIYLKPASSIVRLVEFPPAPDGREFVFPSSDTSLSLGPGEASQIQVPSGGRIVDYRYRRSDEFPDLVRATLGETTFQAAAEISRQTGFRPTKWPPAEGEARRAVLGPAASYRAAPSDTIDLNPPSPEAETAFRKLAEDRRRVGIHPHRLLSFGTVYRVMVGDPSATARDVALLLYGDDREHLEIARRAGFAVPEDRARRDPSFNPRLFGTAFEITVDYTREYFPYAEEHDATLEARVVRLLNGAVIERYDRAADQNGVWEITRYPNGFKRVTFKPNGPLLSLARAVAFVRGIGDASLDRSTAEALRRHYTAEFIWSWSLALPREEGDIPDAFDVRQIGDAEVVVASIGPRAPATPVVSALDRFWGYSPPIKAVAVTVAGVLLVVFVGLLTRSAAGPGRAP